MMTYSTGRCVVQTGSLGWEKTATRRYMRRLHSDRAVWLEDALGDSLLCRLSAADRHNEPNPQPCPLSPLPPEHPWYVDA